MEDLPLDSTRTEAPESPVPEWNFRHLGMLVLKYLGAAVGAWAAAYLVHGIINGLGGRDRDVWWLGPLTAMFEIIFLLLLLKGHRHLRGALPLWRREELRDPRGWLTLGICLLVVLGAGALRARLAPPAPPIDLPFRSDAVDRVGPLILGTAAIVLLVPVAEEWVFRGILQPLLARRMPVGWAIFLTAAGFALIHLGRPFAERIEILVLALLLGWVAYRRGSLTYPILVHLLNNLWAMGLVWRGYIKLWTAQ